MSKFSEKYSLPEDVKISLEDVVFYVQLPTSANRRFERAVASSLSVRDPKTGAFTVKDVTMADIFTTQHKAFIQSCVSKAEGPIEFDRDTFYDEYPEAAEELYTLASDMATKVEGEAVESLGKSQPSSHGQSGGKVKTSSMQDSLKAAG